ncbi:hypothetical protein ACFPRL_24305 [Pseudoclavibacter helvolus]
MRRERPLSRKPGTRQPASVEGAGPSDCGRFHLEPERPWVDALVDAGPDHRIQQRQEVRTVHERGVGGPRALPHELPRLRGHAQGGSDRFTCQQGEHLRVPQTTLGQLVDALRPGPQSPIDRIHPGKTDDLQIHV